MDKHKTAQPNLNTTPTGWLPPLPPTRLGLALAFTLALGLLAACGETPRPPVTPAPARPTAALAPDPEPTPPARPTATAEAVALLPANTPPAPAPTRFPTATPRPDKNNSPVIGSSLASFRTTRVSFQTAYGKAAARMSAVSGAARLALAQSTQFTLDRTIWTFFFTIPQGSRSWSVNYDSGSGKDAREIVSVVERAGALLPGEAGKWAVSKVLDSDDVTTRLLNNGLPPELPVDTIFVQQVATPRQGTIPAYFYVNGALGKQLIVNALTGELLQNDFF